MPARRAIREGHLSITRRGIFLGLALVPLVLLAACGDDDDDSGEAFQLPPAGEYSFEVTGTMEIEIVPEEVSAAPRALGQPETSDVSGNLTIQLGEDGGFTISAKDGATLFAVTPQGDSITFTQNEAIPSTGTISGDGVEVELNLEAELPTGETTTSEEPIRLEGEGNPKASARFLAIDPASVKAWVMARLMR